MEDSLALKINIKRYPIYKMFAWDLLFYYAIIFLFLIDAKGLSASQIFFVDAFYPIFKFIFQIICIRFSDILGNRKAILLGNIFVNGGILLIILCQGLVGLIIANLLLAIGFNFKDLCEAAFLNSSIQNKEKRREIFSKVDGNSSARFYIFDAICAGTAGFLLAINTYFPMVFCLVFSVIGTIISFTFCDTPNNVVSQKQTIHFIKDLRYIFRHIFRSNRLRSLIIFSALFSSILAVFKTLMNSLLVDLKMPAVYFGLITATIQIISSLSSKNQNFFHKKFRNKTLTFFAVPLCVLMLITGLAVSFGISNIIIYLSIILMILFYAIVKGPYHTLIKRYLNSFVSSSITTKIYAATSMCDSLFRSTAYFISSYLLGIATTSYTLIIIGAIFTLIFILLLDYMKTRVGLKPEEYKASDTQIG